LKRFTSLYIEIQIMVTKLSDKNQKLLMQSLFCRPLPVSLRIILVVSIGVLPNLFSEGERLLDPFLLMITPAWSFYILKLLLPVLRYPRKSEWHSILCLDFRLRKQLSKTFIVQKLKECTALQSIGLFLFIIIFMVKTQIHKFDVSLQIAGLAFISIFLMFFFFSIFLSFADYLPQQKDVSHKFASQFSFRGLVIWRTNCFHIISIMFTFFFPFPYRPIIRRNILYLLRSEFLILLLINVAGFFLGVYTSVVISKINFFASTIMLVYIPLLLFFFFTGEISKSHIYLSNYPYCEIAKRTFFIAHLLLLLFWSSPFILCFVYSLTIHQHATNWCIIFFSGIVSFSIVIAFNSYRWTLNYWSTPSKCWFVITIFVCFIAINGGIVGSAIEGVVVPFITLFVLLFFSKQFLKKGSLLHHAKSNL
jgi:hypothetical protein